MNLGGEGCSEPRTRHCTPARVTRAKLRLKKKKKKESGLHAWVGHRAHPLAQIFISHTGEVKGLTHRSPTPTGFTLGPRGCRLAAQYVGSLAMTFQPAPIHTWPGPLHLTRLPQHTAGGSTSCGPHCLRVFESVSESEDGRREGRRKKRGKEEGRKGVR